jgi:hypothetical protein
MQSYLSTYLLRTPSYSHTLENRSSLPPKPPDLLLLVVEVVAVETGAALVHPPKSSSGATDAGAADDVVAAVVDVAMVGLVGTPQPAPMSLDVSVSGILIVLAKALVDEDDCVVGGIVVAAAAGAGAGSGVLQALPPQGSMLAEESMLVTFEVDVVGAAFGVGCWAVLEERLKTDEVDG